MNKNLLWVFLILCCPINADTVPLHAVSMVELIVKPEKYVGKRIELFGYKKDIGIRTLYLTKEHADLRDGANSLAFRDARDGFYDFCEQGYIRLRGVFSRRNSGGYTVMVDDVYSVRESKVCEIGDDKF